MQILKKIFNKIKLAMYYLQMYINVYVISKLYRNKVFVIGTPKHGNIGDQAILAAEEIFIKENFKKLKIIELESNFFSKQVVKFKKCIGSSVIIVHGGGFLGSLWETEEIMFRKVITEFPDNKIIVFPQTIYFSADDEGQKIYNESKKIYGKNKNLIVCCREKYSYEYMQTHFPEVKIMLVPDIVLYNDFIDFNCERKDALFCLRKDKEKISNSFEKIEQVLKENKLNIDYTDTVIDRYVYNYEKNKVLKNKLKQFSKYKIVITDRLHGMVFAYITKTPCIVFENKSYKVKGVYEWIKHCDFIKMYNENDINDAVDNLLNYDKVEEKNSVKEYFGVLINELQKVLKNGGKNE